MIEYQRRLFVLKNKKTPQYLTNSERRSLLIHAFLLVFKCLVARRNLE